LNRYWKAALTAEVASDSLYLRLSEEAPVFVGAGRTSITRTIETTDENASPVELIAASYCHDRAYLLP
jgi:hypothetical protein